MSGQDPEQTAPQSPATSEFTASRKAVATYGSPSHPLAFTIAIADNGAVGYTGILKPLCMKLIWTYGSDFRIGWTPHTSRHADPGEGEQDVRVRLVSGDEGEEGWRAVGEGLVFWDRVVLVGPVEDPVGLSGDEGLLGVREAAERVLRCAGEGKNVKFQRSARGSATFVREQEIWRTFNLSPDAASVECKTQGLAPLPFLAHASASGAYALTTRALVLTAHRDGMVPNLRVYVEGGRRGDREGLLPWFVLTRGKDTAGSAEQRLAVRFAEWLGEDTAQGTLRGYGRVWEEGVPLFTGRERDEIAGEEGLVGREW